MKLSPAWIIITCLIVILGLSLSATLVHLVTEIWVVTCSLEQEIDRLMKRNNLTITEAKTRINNQIPLAQKVAQADFVLDNEESLQDLYRQIDRKMKNR